MSKFKVGNSRFSRFMNGKGFYIALALCLVAIGSAAYIAVNGNFGPTNTAKKNTVSSYSPSQAGLNWDDANNATEQAGANATNIPAQPPTSSQASSSSQKSGSKGSSSASSSEGSASKAVTATFFVLPLQGNVIADFSNGQPVYDKTMDDWRVHNCVDIAADKGTPVKACGDGTVTDVKADDLYGQMVTIDHGNGLVSIYGNLSNEVTVKKGQQIEAGTVIGCVGNTAQGEISLVPHLHFAMTKNGTYVDPLVTIGVKK